jgi:hypothetical protein
LEKERIANLRVAKPQKWRDKTSLERQERTEWNSIAIPDGLERGVVLARGQ